MSFSWIATLQRAIHVTGPNVLCFYLSEIQQKVSSSSLDSCDAIYGHGFLSMIFLNLLEITFFDESESSLAIII